MNSNQSIILGIAAYYHDSAAALLIDGQLVAAAQEERFTRIKHDPAFPTNAIKYVLSEVGLALDDVTAVVFYDKPYIKFERLLETYHALAPSGLKSFRAAIPVWIKEKLFLKRMLRQELNKIKIGTYKPQFPEHHLSHAASAFYPSPFETAAILTVDGVGEWTTTSLGKGDGHSISVAEEIHFPHSLGLLYSAFTYYCGFKVNSGEYKLMGLAPYGLANSEQTAFFITQIKTHLIDIRDDGSFVLNLDHFDYPTGQSMTKDENWTELFGLPRISSEEELTQPYMNLAMAIQQVTEEIVIKLARTACSKAGSRNLVMAGGVALNCVANGKLLQEDFVDNLWIQPAAGDAGGAVGAAYAHYHIGMNQARITKHPDAMSSAYLGPDITSTEIHALELKHGAQFNELSNNQLSEKVAELLAQGQVVGWIQGRMEFGPRALCNRSILGDPRNPAMQKKINLNIKYREGFRPFAPVVLESRMQDFFQLKQASPYMLLVAPITENIKQPLPDGYEQKALYEKLYTQRSSLPAITHVDFSARIQSVTQQSNPKMYALLTAFDTQTGVPVLINTSFNVRGEPIVCTAADAYRCFMTTEMDVLIINSSIFVKNEQPAWQGGATIFAKD